MTYQTCTGDDAFSITNGVISSVIAGFTCVSISERIVSIKDGSPTDYVFMHDIDYVEKVDNGLEFEIEYCTKKKGKKKKHKK